MDSTASSTSSVTSPTTSAAPPVYPPRLLCTSSPTCAAYKAFRDDASNASSTTVQGHPSKHSTSAPPLEHASRPRPCPGAEDGPQTLRDFDSDDDPDDPAVPPLPPALAPLVAYLARQPPVSVLAAFERADVAAALRHHLLARRAARHVPLVLLVARSEQSAKRWVALLDDELGDGLPALNLNGGKGERKRLLNGLAHPTFAVVAVASERALVNVKDGVDGMQAMRQSLRSRPGTIAKWSLVLSENVGASTLESDRSPFTMWKNDLALRGAVLKCKAENARPLTKIDMAEYLATHGRKLEEAHRSLAAVWATPMSLRNCEEQRDLGRGGQVGRADVDEPAQVPKGNEPEAPGLGERSKRPSVRKSGPDLRNKRRRHKNFEEVLEPTVRERRKQIVDTEEASEYLRLRPHDDHRSRGNSLLRKRVEGGSTQAVARRERAVAHAPVSEPSVKESRLAVNVDDKTKRRLRSELRGLQGAALRQMPDVENQDVRNNGPRRGSSGREARGMSALDEQDIQGSSKRRRVSTILRKAASRKRDSLSEDEFVTPRTSFTGMPSTYASFPAHTRFESGTSDKRRRSASKSHLDVSRRASGQNRGRASIRRRSWSHSALSSEHSYRSMSKSTEIGRGANVTKPYLESRTKRDTKASGGSNSKEFKSRSNSIKFTQTFPPKYLEPSEPAEHTKSNQRRGESANTLGDDFDRLWRRAGGKGSKAEEEKGSRNLGRPQHYSGAVAGTANSPEKRMRVSSGQKKGATRTERQRDKLVASAVRRARQTGNDGNHSSEPNRGIEKRDLATIIDSGDDSPPARPSVIIISSGSERSGVDDVPGPALMRSNSDVQEERNHERRNNTAEAVRAFNDHIRKSRVAERDGELHQALFHVMAALQINGEDPNIKSRFLALATATEVIRLSEFNATDSAAKDGSVRWNPQRAPVRRPRRGNVSRRDHSSPARRGARARNLDEVPDVIVID